MITRQAHGEFSFVIFTADRTFHWNQSSFVCFLCAVNVGVMSSWVEWYPSVLFLRSWNRWFRSSSCMEVITIHSSPHDVSHSYFHNSNMPNHWNQLHVSYDCISYFPMIVRTGNICISVQEVSKPVEFHIGLVCHIQKIWVLDCIDSLRFFSLSWYINSMMILEHHCERMN